MTANLWLIDSCYNNQTCLMMMMMVMMMVIIIMMLMLVVMMMIIIIMIWYEWLRERLSSPWRGPVPGKSTPCGSSSRSAGAPIFHRSFSLGACRILGGRTPASPLNPGNPGESGGRLIHWGSKEIRDARRRTIVNYIWRLRHRTMPFPNCTEAVSDENSSWMRTWAGRYFHQVWRCELPIHSDRQTYFFGSCCAPTSSHTSSPMFPGSLYRAVIIVPILRWRRWHQHGRCGQAQQQDRLLGGGWWPGLRGPKIVCISKRKTWVESIEPLNPSTMKLFICIGPIIFSGPSLIHVQPLCRRFWMWPVSWATTLGENWLSWPSPERMLRRSSTCALVHSTWIGSFNVAMSDSTHQISMNHFTWGALGNITANGIYIYIYKIKMIHTWLCGILVRGACRQNRGWLLEGEGWNQPDFANSYIHTHAACIARKRF